jgi:hypothetical protein
MSFWKPCGNWVRSSRSTPTSTLKTIIFLDVLIGHAVRLGWLDQQPERVKAYDYDKAAAWQAFYHTAPRPVRHLHCHGAGVPHGAG